MFGEFGSMKSWLLLDLAIHLAAGVPWLGQFPVPKAQRVLYVDEEMSERTVRRRVKQLGQGANLNQAELPLAVLSHAGVRFTQDGAWVLLRFLEHCQFDPDVMIVETFRRILHGDENSSEDVSQFWCAVEPIRKAGKTLIVSHHMRKPNSTGSEALRNRASGSTDILAGADTGLAVERLESGLLRIECVKMRNAEEPLPFHVRVVGAGVDGPVTLCHAEPGLVPPAKTSGERKSYSGGNGYAAYGVTARA
jgi:RecA-family ATPase